MKSIVHVACGLLSISMIGSVTAGTLGQSAADLHGTARAGGRPARDTVVWLDSPDAPARPATGRVVLDQSGLSRIFCNIHQNMAAYVMTVDSPYFGRADESGAFTIAAVPAGNYTYHAWRPGVATEVTGTWTSTDGPLQILWPWALDVAVTWAVRRQK